MQIVNGYRTKSGSVRRLAHTSEDLIQRVNEVWKAHYIALLKNQISFVADSLVLGSQQYDVNRSVLDIAQERLCGMIRQANLSGAESAYNFVIILEYMYMPDGYVYINVASPNWFIAENLFDNITDMEKFDVSASEAEQATGKIDMWNKIARKYTGSQMSFRQNLIPPLPYPIDEKEYEFEDIQTRAQINAEARERNNILGSLSGGRQIMPSELMHYLNSVEMEMEAPIHKYRIQEYVNQLCGILPVLTYDIVSKPIGQMVDDERRAKEQQAGEEPHTEAPSEE